MNLLIIGRADKAPFLQDLKHPFLVIDDGPIIDTLSRPSQRRYTELDLSKHHFNPLKNIDYRRARDFISVLDAVFPEGENTLTKRGARFHILQSLVENKTGTIDQLIHPTKDPHTIDAHQQIQTLLLSPILSRVLLDRTNFPLNKTIYARLDRAVLGDFDCFFLANLLTSAYEGQVVIPDFGFYAASFHTSLIRQNRLVAGLNFFDEAPDFQNLFLSMDTVASKCIHGDAETLAEHAGLVRDTVGFADAVYRYMS